MSCLASFKWVLFGTPSRPPHLWTCLFLEMVGTVGWGEHPFLLWGRGMTILPRSRKAAKHDKRLPGLLFSIPFNAELVFCTWLLALKKVNEACKVGESWSPAKRLRHELCQPQNNCERRKKETESKKVGKRTTRWPFIFQRHNATEDATNYWILTMGLWLSRCRHYFFRRESSNQVVGSI